MLTTSRVSAGLLVLLVAAAARLDAQPRVARAQMTTVDASSGLAPSIDRVLARREPSWIAWTVPRGEQRGRNCCWTDQCEGCWLEGEPTRAQPIAAAGDRPIALEGDTEILVLVRVADGAVDRVRTVTASCPLDAGGLPFYTLTGVSPTQSLAWLEAQARATTAASGKERRSSPVVHAVAEHGVPEADAVLNRLLDTDPQTRRQVVTSLGLSRGAAGLARLERLVRDETDSDFRRRVVTAIGLSREPRARTLLLDLARRHDEARVRAEALVAVARLAGRDTAATLTEAVERDPDTDVKQKAVFAISRLPPDEGVPLLIKVARDHANPAVRRTAMFWLGQSKDPRAVDFFASILK